jgi:hypothetical protein
MNPSKNSSMTPSESLKLMQKASNEFYIASANSQCHAFVEFTGLMNEYIKVCEDFQKVNPDDDFREYSGHSGKELCLQIHQKMYILEKLECIYQQQILRERFP